MSSYEVVGPTALERRRYWIEEIVRISGNFGSDSMRVEQELVSEVAQGGTQVVLDHLRLCGAMPEAYRHDSSEEKLYSKYTDSVIAVAFRQLGLTTLVLTERADAADVEVVAADYSFVADAKSFRLSRTAKNQKDFKIQAMDGWKKGRKFAVVVAPLYQLPARSSQIYQQAIARNVCILSYSHLASLVGAVESLGAVASQQILTDVLSAVEALPPTKDASMYWMSLNRTMLVAGEQMSALWKAEKQATLEAIKVAKDEGLATLAAQRERLMRLTHAEAIALLVDVHKIDSRMRTIAAVGDNGLMGLA